LSVTNGTWSGVPTSYTYQWFRCNVAIKKAVAKPAASCSTIASAAASTYTLTDADAGKFMVARVSGVNASGTVSIHTASTAVVTPRAIAPVNISAPLVTGIPLVDGVLTVSRGSWNESPTQYSYQWIRCAKSLATASAMTPKKCAQIAGATSSSYQMVVADIAKFLVTAVTAENEMGRSTIFTTSTGRVKSETFAPVAIDEPALEGDVAYGQTLMVDQGTWTGVPSPTLSVSWYRCWQPASQLSGSGLNDCVYLPVSGPTYEITGADVGQYIRAVVTAQNNAGTTRFALDPIARSVSAPVVVDPPVVTGSRLAGSTLEVSSGEFQAFPTPTASYQWYRCTSGVWTAVTVAPSGCVLIAGAVGHSYSQRYPTDNSAFITVATTKTNEYGSQTVWAQAVQRTESVPVFTSLPSMRNAADELAAGFLNINLGSAPGYPHPSFKLTFYRCSAEDPTLFNGRLLECSSVKTVLPGGNQSYWFVDADRGNFIYAVVEWTNRLGSDTARTTNSSWIPTSTG
jgi:hypothetical protein